MQRIGLGNTSEEISIAGLGCMYFGTRVDEKTSFRLLDMYVDHGGNFLDSANKYASWLPGFKGGESETNIGKWLKQNSAPSDLLISSKVGFHYGEIPRSLKKEIIISECEKSLHRMGVETIDIYFAHAYDRDTPIEETMEAFHQLIKAGKIRYAGASNYPGWRLEEANSVARSQGWAGYSCLQQRHTYMEPSSRAEFNNQEFLSPEIEDLCLRKGLSIIAYSPLLGGFYSRMEAPLPALYQNALNEERLLSLRNTCSETGLSPTQLVLAWMVSHSPAIIPLLGCSSSSQLEENLVAVTTSLNPDVVQRLL